MLSVSLAITAAFLAVEVVGGILTDSLALIADAGHMASDVGALSLALVALWLASRPATSRRTYGMHRAEILAAFVSSLALVLIAIFVFVEAAQRFDNPPEVQAGPMLAIAVVGTFANVGAATLLFGRRHDNLNMRSALLHVVGDTLASVGVIIAGLIMLATNEYRADPAISMVIGVLILASSFRIIWETTQVLLEATPPGLSVDGIQKTMLDVPGVRSIHDLHVWTVTSGFVSLSAHVETSPGREAHNILVDLRRALSRNFDIDHATLQLETSALHEELEACCGVDTEEIAASHAVHHS